MLLESLFPSLPSRVTSIYEGINQALSLNGRDSRAFLHKRTGTLRNINTNMIRLSEGVGFLRMPQRRVRQERTFLVCLPVGQFGGINIETNN
jgi:hypothetical protein